MLPTGCFVDVIVTVDPLPAGIGGSGTGNVCIGDSLHLTEPTPGGVWSSSDTTTITVDTSGEVHTVSAHTAIIYYTLPTGGCNASIIINVRPLPVLFIPTPLIMCKGATDTLTASGAGDSSTYVWSLLPLALSCTLCPTTYASPTITTTYFVIGTTTEFGCFSNDSVTVTVDAALNNLHIARVR